MILSSFPGAAQTGPVAVYSAEQLFQGDRIAAEESKRSSLKFHGTETLRSLELGFRAEHHAQQNFRRAILIFRPTHRHVLARFRPIAA